MPQKTVKFRPHLIKMILSGEKTVTWRIFDDKDIQVGDTLELVNEDDLKVFAKAEVLKVYERQLGEISSEDLAGHEKFGSTAEMLGTYRGYYGDAVNWETKVKIISFRLL